MRGGGGRSRKGQEREGEVVGAVELREDERSEEGDMSSLPGSLSIGVTKLKIIVVVWKRRQRLPIEFH